MKMGANRRLANIKTRSETGLDYVMQNIDLNTPFGKKQLKEISPYFPGEEDELRAELDKLELMVEFVKENGRFPILDITENANGDTVIITGDGKGNFLRYTFTE